MDNHGRLQCNRHNFDFFSLTDSERPAKSGMSRTLELLSMPIVTYLFMIRMAAFLPVMLMQSMGAVITMEYFKLGPKENGLMMAAIGAAAAVCIY